MIPSLRRIASPFGQDFSHCAQTGHSTFYPHPFVHDTFQGIGEICLSDMIQEFLWCDSGMLYVVIFHQRLAAIKHVIHSSVRRGLEINQFPWRVSNFMLVLPPPPPPKKNGDGGGVCGRGGEGGYESQVQIKYGMTY